MEAIDRPTTVQKHKAVVDILWSTTYAEGKDIMKYNPTKITDNTINTFLE